MDTQGTIERFILDELLLGARERLDPAQPLVADGVIDSLGMLRLITFLEEQFGIAIGDGDVGPENFQTLQRISSFADGKVAQSRHAD